MLHLFFVCCEKRGKREKGKLVSLPVHPVPLSHKICSCACFPLAESVPFLIFLTCILMQPYDFRCTYCIMLKQTSGEPSCAVM